MTSPAERDTPDYEAQLLELVERGFRFVHPTDADGELAEVVGVRAHDDVIDVVKLRGEHDVLAIRLPADEIDVISPRRVLWQSTGYVDRVLAELLELPDRVGGEGQARGCWLPVGHGASKWVTADA